ncbi:hypothetical protein QYF36_024581 [Acer negundo]|nr:hypothetical protein QYF36_024581 [Acer negundo]
MYFYEQHAYDEESEAMNGLVMKLIDVEQQMGELKSMILAREQVGQLISPSLKEENDEIEEKPKEAKDVPFEEPLLYKELKPYIPPITLPSQPEQEDVITFTLKGEEVEKEEMEEEVKEAKDVPFEELLLYKELKPYVPPITLPSQPEQENVLTFPLKGEELEKEETKEKVKEAEDEHAGA